MKKFPRRATKIPNEQNLRNASLFYLSRYAANEASLRRVLQNRLRRVSLRNPEFAADHAKQEALKKIIEDIIAGHKKSGAVNDAAVASMKVANLRRGGKSKRFIQQKLAARGLDQALIARTLDEHDNDEEGDPELKAAIKLCKKRRLGSFRPKARQKEGDGMRDFAALARAGFSAAIIRKVLTLSPDEEPDMQDLVN